MTELFEFLCKKTNTDVAIYILDTCLTVMKADIEEYALKVRKYASEIWVKENARASPLLASGSFTNRLDRLRIIQTQRLSRLRDAWQQRNRLFVSTVQGFTYDNLDEFQKCNQTYDETINAMGEYLHAKEDTHHEFLDFMDNYDYEYYSM